MTLNIVRFFGAHLFQYVRVPLVVCPICQPQRLLYVHPLGIHSLSLKPHICQPRRKSLPLSTTRSLYKCQPNWLSYLIAIALRYLLPLALANAQRKKPFFNHYYICTRAKRASCECSLSVCF